MSTNNNETFERVRFSQIFKPENTVFIKEHLTVIWNDEFHCYELSLDEIRKVYSKDNELFQNICTEIYLRGGKFYLSSENPRLFPNIEYKDGYIDQIYGQEFAYSNINYLLFDIERQMSAFNIHDNDFYKGIYLNGFEYLYISNSELNLLKQEFNRRGFYFNHQDVTDEEIKEHQNKVYESTENITSLSKQGEEEEKIPNDDTSSEHIEDMTIEEFVRLLPNNINNIYHDLYTRFCHKHVSELSIEDWMSVRNAKGVGSKKYDIFIEFMVNELNLLDMNSLKEAELAKKKSHMWQKAESNKKNFHMLSELKEQYPIINNYKVAEFLFLIPSNEKKIHGRFYSINEKSFVDVTDEQWNDALYGRGMGNKKISLVKEQLKIFIEHLEENKDQWLEKKKKLSLINISSKKEPSLINISSLFKEEDVANYLAISEDKSQDKNQLLSILMDFWPINQIPFTFEEVLDIFKIKINSDFQDEVSELSSMFVGEVLNRQNVVDSLDISVLQMIAVIGVIYDAVLRGKFPPRIQKMLSHLKENEKLVISSRHAKKTLEETGKILDVTRERVRQIETKAKKKIRKNCELYHYKSMFNLLLRKKGLLHYSDGLFGLMCYVYDDYVIDNNFILLKEIYKDLMEIKTIITNELQKSLYFMKDEFCEYITLYDHLEPFLDESYWSWLCNFMNVRQYNDYIYLKSNKDKKRTCELIVALFFEDGFYVGDDTQLETFMRYYDELIPEHSFFTWDESRKDVARRIEGNLERSNLQKISNRTYQYNSVELPVEFVQKVKQYIDEELEELPVVYYSKLQQVFANELEQYHANQFTLYYALKNAYADSEYTFSSGRTPRIFPLGKELSTDEIFATIIEQYGGEVESEWLCEALGIQKYTIEQTVSKKENDITRIGTKLYRSERTNIEEDLIEVLQPRIDSELQQYHAVSTLHIYDSLSFGPQELIEKYQITKENIKSFIIELNPSLKGHQQLLVDNDDVTLWEYCQLYMGKEKEYFSIEELSNVLKGMGYSDTTIGSKLKNAWDNDELYKLNDQQFIDPEQLLLTEEQKKILSCWMDDKCANQRWIRLKEDVGSRIQRRQLGEKLNLRYEITPELLKHLLVDQLGYQYLTIDGLQSVNNMLMVTKDSSLSLEGLLKSSFEQYDGIWKEDNMVDYFIDQRLINENKNHTLPEYVKKTLNLSVDKYTKEVSVNQND